MTQHPSTPAPRPYLAFIRCGEKSLHRRLLAEDPARHWDCCVSWYCPPVEENLAEYYCSGGDNKLEGFVHFHGMRKDLAPYRYILLLDDDVYFRPGDVSRFFELCDRYSTVLAQPALRWSTHFNLRVTLRNPGCDLRRVTFVEVMAPCFRADAIEDLLPTFLASKSTWGVDVAWASILEQSARPMHVVDAIPVEHTKPFDPQGGAFYQRLLAMGVDPYAELRRLQSQYPMRAGRRTILRGNVYCHSLHGVLGLPLLAVFELLKWFVQWSKPLRRLRH